VRGLLSGQGKNDDEKLNCKKSNQKSIQEKRFMEQEADLQEKYHLIKEKEYKSNKEIRDKFILAGYLRHPRL
jgi:hypothetical protein